MFKIHDFVGDHFVHKFGSIIIKKKYEFERLLCKVRILKSCEKQLKWKILQTLYLSFFFQKLQGSMFIPGDKYVYSLP